MSRNYLRVAQFAQSPVMAVIKGDAYGHGLEPCGAALAAAGCGQLGVMNLEEALALKKHRLPADITILSGLHGPVQSLKAVEAGVVVFVYDMGQMEVLASAGAVLRKKARIRLKIDSGMGRLGIPWEKAEKAILKAAANKHLEFLGLATHLATNGDQGANEQLSRFRDLGEKYGDYCSSRQTCSVMASGGVLAHQSFPSNLTRTGLMLYGYSPLKIDHPALEGRDKAKSLIQGLEPVMRVVTRLIQVRDASAGETIGYDRTYRVKSSIRLGTAPIGYAQGLSRTRSSQGHALVRGREAKLLGRVCMNLTMYDLSGISARPGDEVVLLGRQGEGFIGADQFGDWQNTSPYEILCHLGRQTLRVYRQSSEGAGWAGADLF